MSRLLRATPLLVLAACAPVAAPCPKAAPVMIPAPVAAAPAPGALPSKKHRDKVAVLPIEEDELYRLERAALRTGLLQAVARELPDYEILPLAEVDTKLRRVSKAGKHCAYPWTSSRERADRQGWLSTHVMHVGAPKGKPPEVWVEIGTNRHKSETLAGVWKRGPSLFDSYRQVFAALGRDRSGTLGVLGGLGISGRPKGTVAAGAVTLCDQPDFWSCSEATADWTDRASELQACFAGESEARATLLVEGGSPARCELVNLDDTSGPLGEREKCLCAAAGGSRALAKSGKRRRLRLYFEASDVTGLPRPRLRLIEASGNLRAHDDWESFKEKPSDKRYTSIQRLAVDNLDALAAPLSRCKPAPGSTVVGDVTVGEAGYVTAATVATSDKKAKACLEQALKGGAFDCTNDGKPATLRLAILGTAP